MSQLINGARSALYTIATYVAVVTADIIIEGYFAAKEQINK